MTTSYFLQHELIVKIHVSLCATTNSLQYKMSTSVAYMFSCLHVFFPVSLTFPKVFFRPFIQVLKSMAV